MTQRSYKRYGNKVERKKYNNEFTSETAEIDKLYELPNNSGSKSKNEKIIPNRVFIGGIPSIVTELDIKQKLSAYGTVRSVRIIRDCIGASKGYGFVTFELEDDARKALEKGEITLNGKKLHIAPAFKKQAYSIETYPVFSRKYEYQNSRMQDFNQYEPIKGDGEFSHLSEISNLYVESGQCYGATDILLPYGTPQANLLSNPTLVYVPQQAFQYSRGIAPLYLGTSVPEMCQLIPVPNCCFNGQQ